jgi:bla regulator protein BlaR1
MAIRMRHPLYTSFGRAAAPCIVAAAAVCALAAQTAPATAHFEAASVKANKSGGTNGMLRREPGGRIEASNMPLRMLITFAYELQPFRLVGGPDWVNTERFDIVAKFDGDPPPTLPGGPPDPMRLSMRALLEERFHLELREEMRDLDTYNLVIARADGKPGAALKPTAQDCSPDALRQRAAAGPPALPAPGEMMQCGMMMNPGRVRSGGMPLSQLAGVLSGQVGRIVNDKTGLSGGFDFEMTYSPTGIRPPGAGPGDAPPLDSDAPSIYTALQEQLGLKLEPAKAPVDVFVIENVERPTDD